MLSTQNRLFIAMTPSFYSLTDTRLSLHYTIKTHLSGPPISRFEANMNYIHLSPNSFMKRCNKSATVKFQMELLLIPRPGSNLGSNLAVVQPFGKPRVMGAIESDVGTESAEL